MDYTNKDRPEDRSISVSELGAYGGSCEMKAYLRYRRGVGARVRTAESVSGEETHARMAIGAIEHERARRNKERDQRCYIATAVFGGQAIETNALRKWRDEVLLKRKGGRLVVQLYYLLSPHLVRAIKPHSITEQTIRSVLTSFVNYISKKES